MTTNSTASTGTAAGLQASADTGSGGTGTAPLNFFRGYDITLDASPVAGGDVNGAYNSDSSFTATATPNNGYNFVNWTDNGQVQSTSQNYTFTPTSERTLVANFTLAPTPTIRISASSTQVNEGDNVTFTIFASSNTVRPVTINYAMTGKALFGSDYTLSNGLGQSGQITIPLGADSVVVTLTAVADHAPEKKETAIMTLNTGAGYKLAKPKKAKVKILDAP